MIPPATNTPLYVHSKSNHPTNIIRNIPESINENYPTFSKAAAPHQGALHKSSYTYSLKFKPSPQTPPDKRADVEI